MANPEWENYQSTESKLGEIITYRHHDAIVSVRKNLKGLHREHCLCYDCGKFKPGVPEENCPIANMIYAVCIVNNVVTPVWECKEFKRGEHYVSTDALKEVIENMPKRKEPGTPDLSETVKSLVEHKKDCAFMLAAEAGKISSEISQCDCRAISGK